MKVLMISGDSNVLNPASNAGKRTEWYRAALGEVDILICRGNIFSFLDKFLMGLGMMWQKKYDVITAQDVEHSFLAWLFSMLHGVPWQMQVHTDIFSPYFAKQSFKNRMRVLLARFLLPRANGVRVVSERIKKSIISTIGYKLLTIFVLPIFVDTEYVRAYTIKTDLHKKYPGRFIILMASRITKEKNIAMAIDVLKEVSAHPRDPLLLIVGDGPEAGDLKRTAKGSVIERNIKFEHFTDDLYSYYKTCDLFLLTSNYEGYGMTLVEASLAGAEIISTDVGIAPDILSPENIIPVGDKKLLSMKISDALDGNIGLPRGPNCQTKDEYLRLYKEALEQCMKK